MPILLDIYFFTVSFGYITGSQGPTGPPGGNGCSLPPYAFVFNGSTVNVIDPISHEVTASIAMPFTVTSMGSDPVTRRLYLLSASGTLAVLDGDSNAIVSEIILPPGNYAQSGVAVNPNNHQVYIASPSNPFVVAVNGYNDTVAAQIPVQSTGSVVVNSRTNLTYVSSPTGLEGINSNSNQLVLKIPFSPGELKNLIAYSCKNLILSSDGSRLVVIDGKRNTIENAARAQDGIWAMALDGSLGLLFVINETGNAVNVYDACSLEFRGGLMLNAGSAPTFSNISVDARNHLVYVSDTKGQGIYIADGGLNQSIAAIADTGAGEGIVTLACDGKCC